MLPPQTTRPLLLHELLKGTWGQCDAISIICYTKPPPESCDKAFPQDQYPPTTLLPFRLPLTFLPIPFPIQVAWSSITSPSLIQITRIHSIQSLIFKNQINIKYQPKQHMSFCCQTVQPEYKYEVKSFADNEHGEHVEAYKYFNSLEDVDHLVKENENVSITKVKTQLGLNDLKLQMKKDNQKFVDQTFPPERANLGHIEDNITWKRIPELIRNQRPVLFDKKVEPSDVIAGHAGDCYLLSSLAALAEFPEIIKRIFRGQSQNEEGLYKVNLRVDGVVEEVVIDDFIPVHENGLPVFCQPNKSTGEFWVVLLEKALAKVNGGYSNLNEGIPSDVFRAVTYAPSESLVFAEESQQKEKVWNLIKEYSNNHYPLCATTQAQVNEELGLEKSHTYTIITAADLEGPHGHERVVKLRNPWKAIDYKGQCNINDHQFWESLNESQEKTSIKAENNNCEYGLFYMKFSDFCQNFNQIHYCNLNSGGKFLSEELVLNNKACFYDVNIQREGVYTFELNQSKISGLSEEERAEEGFPRSTLLLIRKERNEQGYRYEFANGTMKYNETNTTLTEQLTPGEYVLYAKIDPTFKSKHMPPSATINLYSKNFASLQAAPRTKYPSLLRQTFIDHAFHHKKNEYSDCKVWISWQLLFQKGGFAYLAAGNAPDSLQNVVIHFSEEQFHALNFKLKKPLKGLGNEQILRIPPGQADIIIVRVINDPNVKTVKFPPKLNIKLESLMQ